MLHIIISVILSITIYQIFFKEQVGGLDVQDCIISGRDDCDRIIERQEVTFLRFQQDVWAKFFVSVEYVEESMMFGLTITVVITTAAKFLKQLSKVILWITSGLLNILSIGGVMKITIVIDTD